MSTEMNLRNRTLLVGAVLAVGIIAAVVVGIALIPTSGGTPAPVATTSSPGKESPSTENTRAEVERAYLGFWDAWIQASKTLEGGELDQFLTGQALTQAQGLLLEARAKREPISVQVTHSYSIQLVDDLTASVDDTFVDRSVRLDPVSGLQTGQAQDKTIRNSYTLKRVGDEWKIAEIIGYRSPSP